MVEGEAGERVRVHPGHGVHQRLLQDVDNGLRTGSLVDKFVRKKRPFRAKGAKENFGILHPSLIIPADAIGLPDSPEEFPDCS